MATQGYDSQQPTAPPAYPPAPLAYSPAPTYYPPGPPNLQRTSYMVQQHSPGQPLPPGTYQYIPPNQYPYGPPPNQYSQQGSYYSNQYGQPAPQYYAPAPTGYGGAPYRNRQDDTMKNIGVGAMLASLLCCCCFADDVLENAIDCDH
ncbi:hypothetical protein Bpfe_016094 [Biomphalaria pfeifferi]|uniref:Uncharacterized protein n=1 Tax=Biomphalaria pfeifferi TaxID=112525 RepID=A0AAD8BIC4_BIOPF|nr:hypothetical protein Bpfe_016094 [Biomphalaria pfeifferi]